MSCSIPYTYNKPKSQENLNENKKFPFLRITYQKIGYT